MIGILHTADWHLGKKLDQHDRTAEHYWFFTWLTGINTIKNAVGKWQTFHADNGEDAKIFSLLEEKGDGDLFGNKKLF